MHPAAFFVAHVAPCPLLAALSERVPGIFIGVPLLAVAAFVFAATHHEHPAAIGRTTLEWLGWLGGILGGVLVAVMILGWLV